MDFQAVAMVQKFRANLEKKVNFTTKVLYPGSNTSCVPAVPKKLTERPRLSGSLVEKMMMEGHLDVGLPFPVECAGPPYVNIVRGNCF